MAIPKPAPSLTLDFDEAVEYFRRHKAVTREEWERLDAAARKRAVRVASIAHRGVLNDVWQDLEKAVAKGTEFRTFKEQIAEKLRKKYGAEGGVPAHLETIYLNETHRAFTHGRVIAALDPDVRHSRPFWQFKALEDNRITPICKECSDTIAEAGGPWWREHMPPLHHRCRSSFVTLTPSQAGQRGGVTNTPPRSTGSSGFGRMPDVDDDGARLEAAKTAQLPRELQPRLELAIPEGPPGHPKRPPKTSLPETPGDPLGEPVGEEIGEPILPPAARPPARPVTLKPEPPWWPNDGQPRRRGSYAEDEGVKVQPKEKRVIDELVAQGNQVRFLRAENLGAGTRTADLRVGRGSALSNVELKALEPPEDGAPPQSDKTLRNAVVNAAKRAWKGNAQQARCIIVDVRPRGVPVDVALEALLELQRNARRHFDFIRVIGDGFDVTVEGTP